MTQPTGFQINVCLRPEGSWKTAPRIGQPLPERRKKVLEGAHSRPIEVSEAHGIGGAAAKSRVGLDHSLD